MLNTFRVVFVTQKSSGPTDSCAYLQTGNTGFYSYDWGSGRNMGVSGHYSFDKRTPWHFVTKYETPIETGVLWNSAQVFGNNENVGGGTGAYVGGGDWSNGSTSVENSAVGWISGVSRDATIAGNDGATGVGCLVNSPCETEAHGPALFTNFQDHRLRGNPTPINNVDVNRIGRAAIVTTYNSGGEPWGDWSSIGYGWHGVAPELAYGSSLVSSQATNMNARCSPTIRAEEITLHAPSELYGNRSKITGAFPEVPSGIESGAIDVNLSNSVGTGEYVINDIVEVDDPSEWPKGLFLSAIGAGGPAGACISQVNSMITCSETDIGNLCTTDGEDNPFTLPTRKGEHGVEGSVFLRLCNVGEYLSRGLDIIVVSSPGKGGVDYWNDADEGFNTQFPDRESRKSIVAIYKGVGIEDIVPDNLIYKLSAWGGRATRINDTREFDSCGDINEATLCVYDCDDDPEGPVYDEVDNADGVTGIPPFVQREEGAQFGKLGFQVMDTWNEAFPEELEEIGITDHISWHANASGIEEYPEEDHVIDVYHYGDTHREMQLAETLPHQTDWDVAIATDTWMHDQFNRDRKDEWFLNHSSAENIANGSHVNQEFYTELGTCWDAPFADGPNRYDNVSRSDCWTNKLGVWIDASSYLVDNPEVMYCETGQGDKPLYSSDNNSCFTRGGNSALSEFIRQTASAQVLGDNRNQKHYWNLPRYYDSDWDTDFTWECPQLQSECPAPIGPTECQCQAPDEQGSFSELTGQCLLVGGVVYPGIDKKLCKDLGGHFYSSEDSGTIDSDTSILQMGWPFSVSNPLGTGKSFDFYNADESQVITGNTPRPGVLYSRNNVQLYYNLKNRGAFYLRDRKTDGTLSPLYMTWNSWQEDKCADAVRLWGRRRIIFDQSDETNRNHPLRVYETGPTHKLGFRDTSGCDEDQSWIVDRDGNVNNELPFGASCQPIDNTADPTRPICPLDLLTHDIQYELDGVQVNTWQEYADGFNSATVRRVIFDFRNKDTHFDDIDPRFGLHDQFMAIPFNPTSNSNNNSSRSLSLPKNAFGVNTTGAGFWRYGLDYLHAIDPEGYPSLKQAGGDPNEHCIPHQSYWYREDQVVSTGIDWSFVAGCLPPVFDFGTCTNRCNAYGNAVSCVLYDGYDDLISFGNFDGNEFNPRLDFDLGTRPQWWRTESAGSNFGGRWNADLYPQPLGRSIACCTPPSRSYTVYTPGLPGAAGGLKLWGQNIHSGTRASEGVGGNAGACYVGFGKPFNEIFGGFDGGEEEEEGLPVLLAGNTPFASLTEVPEFVGDPEAHGYHCEPIVRWITHPFQPLSPLGLEIGLAAYHVEGIDRVEFDAGDGIMRVVSPIRRGCVEIGENCSDGAEGYWVKLKPGNGYVNDGQLREVRATVYPVNGKPIVLQSKNPNHVVPDSDTEPIDNPSSTKLYKKDILASNYAMWYSSTTSRAVYILDPTTDSFENAFNKIQTSPTDQNGNPWIEGSTCSPVIKIKNNSPLKMPWDDTIGVTFWADNGIQSYPFDYIPGMITIEPEFEGTRIGFTGNGPAGLGDLGQDQMMYGMYEFKNCDFHHSTRMNIRNWTSSHGADEYYPDNVQKRWVTYFLQGCTFDGGVTYGIDLENSPAWMGDAYPPGSGGMTGMAWFHSPRTSDYSAPDVTEEDQVGYSGQLIMSQDRCSLATCANSTITNGTQLIPSVGDFNLVNSTISNFTIDAMPGVNCAINVNIKDQLFGLAGSVLDTRYLNQMVDWQGGFDGDENLNQIEYLEGTYVRIWDTEADTFTITRAVQDVPIGTQLKLGASRRQYNSTYWNNPSAFLPHTDVWQTREENTGKNVLIVDNVWTGVVGQPIMSWNDYSYPQDGLYYATLYEQNELDAESSPEYLRLNNVGFIRNDITQTTLKSAYIHWLEPSRNQVDSHLLIDGCTYRGKGRFGIGCLSGVEAINQTNDTLVPTGGFYNQTEIRQNERLRTLKYYQNAPTNSGSTSGHAIRNSTFDRFELAITENYHAGTVYNGAYGNDPNNVDLSVEPELRIMGSQIPFQTLWNLFGVTVDNNVHHQRSLSNVATDASYAERYTTGPTVYTNVRNNVIRLPYPYRLGGYEVNASYDSRYVDTTENGTKKGEIFLKINNDVRQKLQLRGSSCGVSVFNLTGDDFPEDIGQSATNSNAIGGINFYFNDLQKATDFRNKANYLTRLIITLSDSSGTDTGVYWTNKDPEIIFADDYQLVSFQFSRNDYSQSFTYDDLITTGTNLNFKLFIHPDHEEELLDFCDTIIKPQLFPAVDPDFDDGVVPIGDGDDGDDGDGDDGGDDGGGDDGGGDDGKGSDCLPYT